MPDEKDPKLSIDTPLSEFSDLVPHPRPSQAIVAKKKRRDQRMRGIMNSVKRRMPWLEDSDMPTLRSWAELESVSRELYDRLRSEGVARDDGEPRATLDAFRKIKTT